jgi:hypothetical protein
MDVERSEMNRLRREAMEQCEAAAKWEREFHEAQETVDALEDRLARCEERRDLIQDVGDNLMLLLTKLMEECDAMARRGVFRDLSAGSRRKIDTVIEAHRTALAGND